VVVVHRSEVLRNLTVVVHGRAGALVVDPAIPAVARPMNHFGRFVHLWRDGDRDPQRD
jgi:hypothetical protein